MAHTWTFDKLLKNSLRLNPKTRGQNSPHTPKFEICTYTSGQNSGQKVIVPYMGTNSLLISLRAWGVTQASLHAVTLLFSDVEILTENPNSSNYFQIQYDEKMYWIHKLDRFKNPLTFRCSCFTADTEVLLANGTYKPFKELEGKTDFEIIGYNDKEDKFEIVTAKNCEKKKENADLVEIVLDNDKIIKCTPEHKFLKRNGEYVSANELQPGDSLRVLYYNEDTLQRYLPDGSREKIKKHQTKEDFYVYVYLDTRYPGEYVYPSCSFNYKPIYIGKGRQNRCYSHLHNKSTDRFHNTVRYLLKNNIPPLVLKQKTMLTEETAYRIEAQLIKEIGLEIEGNGPLLNNRQGGLGGLSSQSALKTKIKNTLNDSFAKISERMKLNNPMKNPKIAKRMSDTYKQTHSAQERSIIAYKASHSMSKKARQELGLKNAQKQKERIENGTHHTLTDWWKEACRKNQLERFKEHPKLKEKISKTSKRNWQNPDYRENILKKKQIKDEEKIKIKTNNTKQVVQELIRKYGIYNRSEYKNIYKQAEKNSLYSYNAMIPSIHGDILQSIYEVEYGSQIDPIKMNFYCNLIVNDIKKKILNKQLPNIEDYKKYTYLQDNNILNNTLFKKLLSLANKQLFTNHKVKEVRYIEEKQDVYCLTAEYLGNFVIRGDNNQQDSSGIVVMNCADTFFTWAFPAFNVGHCFYGPAPRPYIRKTKTRSPRNPHNIVGICKHVINAWPILRNSGLTMN